ncbi:MAG: hypothetical protein U0S36_07560 [Candidatus Nanopelagicales bacterium]|jgi:hypothetical protein
MNQGSEIVTAYAFVRETAISVPYFLQAVTLVEPVKRALPLVGNYLAFVRVEAGSLKQLQDEVVPAVHDAGARLAEWSIATAQPFLGRPVKTALASYGALVQVSSTAPSGIDSFIVENFSDVLGDVVPGAASQRVQGGSTTHVVDLVGHTAEQVDELLARFASVPGGSGLDVSFTFSD